MNYRVPAEDRNTEKKAETIVTPPRTVWVLLRLVFFLAEISQN